jgi:hypothetical protein
MNLMVCGLTSATVMNERGKSTRQNQALRCTSGLVVRGIAAGSHTLTLKTSKSTVVGVNDFFNVTILELPFE